MQTVFDSLSVAGGCFSYLARDLLLMLCEWKAEADELDDPDTLPLSDEAGALLASLVERLMAVCESENKSLIQAPRVPTVRWDGAG